MDPIVTTALVGTARQERVKLTTGTPVDALLAELPEGEIERTFLLSAGAWAVYRQAGKPSQQLVTTPEPASAEQRPVCSSSVALLLSRLLGGEQAALLPEALERLHALGMRLPYHLLPQALNTTGKELHAAVFPVLGERGRWLSQFNPAWKWVRKLLPTVESTLPPETIWQEGSLVQRVEVLSSQRAIDPEQARTWLEAVWKQEKADARCDLLQTLEVGLNAADEPFLETALDDRALSVRLLAAALLSRLPDSALSERMRQRGISMLKMAGGKLGLELPAAFGKDWQRDGIVEKPPSNTGKRAWWLVQILALIPPTFWETHLGAGPAELLELLSDNEWRVNIVEGWSKAAVSYRAFGWATPLWNWWLAPDDRRAGKRITDDALRENLMKCMSQEEAENALLALYNADGPKNDEQWLELLSELPKPWSVAFTRSYLQLLHAYCAAHISATENYNAEVYAWLTSMAELALAMPVACLGEALPEIAVSENPSWQERYAHQQIQECTETIHIRQKIHEEIV